MAPELQVRPALSLRTPTPQLMTPCQHLCHSTPDQARHLEPGSKAGAPVAELGPVSADVFDGPYKRFADDEHLPAKSVWHAGGLGGIQASRQFPWLEGAFAFSTRAVRWTSPCVRPGVDPAQRRQNRHLVELVLCLTWFSAL